MRAIPILIELNQERYLENSFFRVVFFEIFSRVNVTRHRAVSDINDRFKFSSRVIVFLCSRIDCFSRNLNVIIKKNILLYKILSSTVPHIVPT